MDFPTAMTTQMKMQLGVQSQQMSVSLNVQMEAA